MGSVHIESKLLASTNEPNAAVNANVVWKIKPLLSRDRSSSLPVLRNPLNLKPNSFSSVQLEKKNYSEQYDTRKSLRTSACPKRGQELGLYQAPHWSTCKMTTTPGLVNGGGLGIRQKRIMPSRSRRGGPGIGSTDVDLMILDTQKRKCALSITLYTDLY
jgi:hypothetical protein